MPTSPPPGGPAVPHRMIIARLAADTAPPGHADFYVEKSSAGYRGNSSAGYRRFVVSTQAIPTKCTNGSRTFTDRHHAAGV